MPRGDGTGPTGMGPMTGCGTAFAQVLKYPVFEILRRGRAWAEGEDTDGCYGPPV